MTTIHEQLMFLLAEIELPDRAHDLALKRYQDLGEWFSRPQSRLVDFDAHIFVQGSFAFGTAIRPLNPDDEYDLDFTCKLRACVSRTTHTQEQLKELVGAELAAYRVARNILTPLRPKNRCWRLKYRDQIPFHLDVVPAIRADDARRAELGALMETRGIDSILARQLASRALWITDQRDRNFKQISPAWPSSNPGGYGLWFLTRLQPRPLGKLLLAEAQVDPAPIFRDKAPLQQATQLLKRHRDVMFSTKDDAKPVSIIITTIAGHAVQPGDTLVQCLERTLTALEQVRLSNTDEILNPVNPNENFADRWQRADCQRLNLKVNFHNWIMQARRDFAELLAGPSLRRFIEMTEDVWQVSLPEAVKQRLGVAVAAPTVIRQVSVTTRPPPPYVRPR